jgi:hypothetical protein
MSRYDAREAEQILATYARRIKRPGETAGAAARVLLLEFAPVANKLGLQASFNEMFGVLTVHAPNRLPSLALGFDEANGDILFLNGDQVIGRLDGLQFNPLTQLLEGTEVDQASREKAYLTPKRSALAVLAEAVLARLDAGDRK